MMTIHIRQGKNKEGIILTSIFYIFTAEALQCKWIWTVQNKAPPCKMTPAKLKNITNKEEQHEGLSSNNPTSENMC